MIDISYASFPSSTSIPREIHSFYTITSTCSRAPGYYRRLRLVSASTLARVIDFSPGDGCNWMWICAKVYSNRSWIIFTQSSYKPLRSPNATEAAGRTAFSTGLMRAKIQLYHSHCPLRDYVMSLLTPPLETRASCICVHKYTTTVICRKVSLAVTSTAPCVRQRRALYLFRCLRKQPFFFYPHRIIRTLPSTFLRFSNHARRREAHLSVPLSVSTYREYVD